ncbi:MAG: enoyl-CoA hydratase-related protein [Solirubrobacteraceae bacterium]|nr:enoyl-CoA hydratase-related protein [Solirubrobacteraceae bacterium]
MPPAATDESAPTRVAYASADGLGRLRLVAGDRRNAIDQRWVDELTAAVDLVEADGDLRALLVDADGVAFCVGGDLAYIGGRADRLSATLDEMIGGFHAALGRLAEIDVPVVCAVQGGAAGGGLGLLWIADIVVAADDLRLATGFDTLGLSGDGNASWWLPRLIGLRRAQHLLLEGPVLDAATAAEWGLVTRVVARDELGAHAEETARRLAAGPTRGLGRIRRMLRTAGDVDVHERLAGEHASMIELGATDDAREGITAFVERRRPTFHGR